MTYIKYGNINLLPKNLEKVIEKRLMNEKS
jgi:hypothetical protein